MVKSSHCFRVQGKRKFNILIPVAKGFLTLKKNGSLDIKITTTGFQ